LHIFAFAIVLAGREVANMDRFTIRIGTREETFLPTEDFAEGHERLHWTLAGIEKLITLGVWKREYTLRGILKTKPPRVEKLLELAPPGKRGASTIPPLSQSPRA